MILYKPKMPARGWSALGGKKFIFIIFILSVLLLPSVALAEIISLPNPLSVDNFSDLIDAVINWLLIISLPIVILLIVFAGFQYMVSGVSPDAQKQAISMVKYAVIGYAIMLLAKVLVGVVTGIF